MGLGTRKTTCGASRRTWKPSPTSTCFANPPKAAHPTSGTPPALAANPQGLAEGRAAEGRGKFKVPTLRNIAKTGPYFHNGSFSSLKQVVAFYNRRDSEPTHFGAPEVSANVNRTELGNLGLTDEEEDAVVAFLHTLTDGYRQ